MSPASAEIAPPTDWTPGGRRLERVAGAPLSTGRGFAVLAGVGAYVAFNFGIVVAAASDSPDFATTEMWIVIGVLGLEFVVLAAIFGHFVAQWVGALGVLYARESGAGWELGPAWGFVFRRRLAIDPGARVAVSVRKLTARERNGRNYANYRWDLRAGDAALTFRSTVGLSDAIRDDIAQWGQRRFLRIDVADPDDGTAARQV